MEGVNVTEVKGHSRLTQSYQIPGPTHCMLCNLTCTVACLTASLLFFSLHPSKYKCEARDRGSKVCKVKRREIILSLTKAT